MSGWMCCKELSSSCLAGRKQGRVPPMASPAELAAVPGVAAERDPATNNYVFQQVIMSWAQMGSDGLGCHSGVRGARAGAARGGLGH
jgi:hypothetical protein